MDQGEQINAFMTDMQSLVKRYNLEFDLSYASAIGCLELMKHELMQDYYEIVYEIEIDIDDDEEEDWKNG